MKMTYALLIGCLPLGLLTIESFLSAGQDRKVAPSPKENADALGALAKQQQAEAGKAAEYLQRLEKGDLLSSREFPAEVSLVEPLTPSGKKWFGPVHQSWNNAQTAHDGVVGFVAMFHPKPISEKQKLVTELENFAARTSPLGAQGDLSFVRFVEYVTSLGDELRPQIEADEHRSKAQKLFSQKNYSDCLKELESINRAKLDKQQLEGVKELQRQAEFWQYWKTEPTESDVSLTAIERRKAFLQKSPSAVLDDEKAKIEEVKRVLALAECQQEFKELRDQLPAQIHVYLSRAEKLVKNEATPPDVRPALRTQFLKIVTSKLPVRDSGIRATTVKETIRKKNGTPIAGVFQDAGDPNRKWYKYWKTVSEFEKLGETEYGTEYLQSFKDMEPPQKPLYMRHADEFNEGRKKLLAHWKSEDEWNTFKMLCERLQLEWKDYRDRGGLAEFERAAEIKTRDLEIEAALSLANEVLKEWSSVAELIRE